MINESKSPFTLVELLVVIGMIAMLVSIMLPALNQTRLVAYSINCTNNLKQVGIAFSAYTNDYDYYPPSNKNTGNDYRWSWVMRTAGYFPNLKILYCNAVISSCPVYADYIFLYPTTSWVYGRVSYGYNVVGIGDNWYKSSAPNTPEIPAKCGNVKNPSMKVLHADARGTVTNGPSYFVDAYGGNGQIDSRHSRNANILWVDGHSSSVKNGISLQLNPNLQIYF